jgi:hypothetical protein
MKGKVLTKHVCVFILHLLFNKLTCKSCGSLEFCRHPLARPCPQQQSDWLQLLLPTVLGYSRTHTEMKQILVRQDNVFRLDTAKSDNAGVALRHAEMVVKRHLSFQTQTFKVGYTHQPSARFFHPVYGYSREFRRMIILCAYHEAGFVGMLEAALIRLFESTVGCLNKARGGENLVGPPPYFCYVVLHTMAPG